jgi:hypothetical protein
MPRKNPKRQYPAFEWTRVDRGHYTMQKRKWIITIQGTEEKWFITQEWDKKRSGPFTFQGSKDVSVEIIKKEMENEYA